ncbi:trimethylamine methyltransferase family protein [Desulfurivibrio dismutans]|uniref:trimethylamine methyltransferase family protein n=1 Tax=Desulfurivibrio dismutans TaxID=1398908 RepID=UPI0023DA76A9|nr:trimethylamine methyltransferase family protein [Desulfurivibrio alkaliphilus]MDF1614318.1 trimethylamine methyltransferase family protein [Desulfurivibrio alkaliphilus]
MKVRKGIEGGRYQPLTQEDIKRIHQAAMQVFEEIGVQVNFPAALELFAEAGAQVDRETNIVKMPGSLVEKIIGQAPSVINLCGRDPEGEHDCEIGGTKVYMGTGGTALNVQEPGSDEIRRSQTKDIMNMARMVEQLDNIHFYMLNVYPGDVTVEDVDVNRFGAALNRTQKHIMGGVYTVEGVRNVIKMAEMIAGSPEALRERPFISMVTCPISPFKLDESYGELTMEAARNRIPVVVPTEPLCGATAPVTLAANLVVQTVDSLAGVMLAQLTNPGAPCLFGCISSITDLRDLKYLAGAVEMGLMNAGAAQMAQYYKLPFYATAGMTDSKVVDAQAGYESAMTSVMVALAGANFIHDAAGFIEFCLTASYDKLVVDNEILGMTMRAVEGIRVDDETIAMAELKKAGPGGQFVTARHTRRLMRTEHYSPELSDRDNRGPWQQAGAQDTRQRATARSREILDAPLKSILPEDVRQRIKTEIPGLQPFLMED